jgi:hypothetical protein
MLYTFLSSLPCPMPFPLATHDLRPAFLGSFAMRSAPCAMRSSFPYALCPLPSALFFFPLPPCSLPFRYTLCAMRYACFLFPMPHSALCPSPLATCYLRLAFCRNRSFPYAPCLSAMRSPLCALRFFLFPCPLRLAP